MLNLCSNGVRGSALMLHPRTLVRPHSASIDYVLFEGYLVNNPAPSRRAASTPTLTKVPVCRSSEKKNNPNSTIDFLKKIGLDDSQVGKIVNYRPRLLRCKVEKTLIPKIRVLQDFGICGSELISVIVSCPFLLLNVSRNRLLAKLDFLKSTLGSVENARNAIIKRARWLLFTSLTKTMQPNFELLKSYGISDERLQKFFLGNLRYLCCNPTWFQERLDSVEQVLGIPRGSDTFVLRFLVTVSLRKKTLQLKFEMFKRYGWSESDVRVMAKRRPECLLIKEAKLKTRVDFFINKHGYEIGYLVTYPALLCFSMEDRILPRHAFLQVLQEKELLRRNPSIYTYMRLTESRFLDAYVLPFKDKLPELYEAYAGKKGYLVNNPAFSRGAASTPTLTKVPVLRVRRSSEKKNNPNSTIDFLKDIGLDDSKVEKIVKSNPLLLRSEVKKTLIPKIRDLEDLGICGSELISLIANNPYLLTSFSRNRLLAKLDFLKSFLGSVENARNAIVKKAYWLLSASLTKVLQPNLKLLKSYGISDERLQKFLVKNPRCLSVNPKHVQESLVRVEQELGIPRESGLFLYGFKVTVSLSKRDLELKFEMFKRYGWSESDVVALAKRMPQVLLTSEAKLKTGVDFFMNKLGYEIGYLVARPWLLTYSMENRILPRYAVWQVLQEKELRNPSISSVITITESQFLNTYVLPFKDNFPELYEAYVGGKKSVDSSVQKENGKQ
ncbi:hypothetical protein Dimus_023880 [Dionaea muscipula]